MRGGHGGVAASAWPPKATRCVRACIQLAFAPEHPAVEVVRGHAAARHLVLHPVEEVRADLKRLHAEAGLPQCVHQSDGDRGLAYA